jgi:hypothetical protein
VAITFTRIEETLDPVTGLVTVSTSTITGSAIQVRPSASRYAAVGLSVAANPSLLFTPSAYPLRANTDEFVMPGDTVVWNTKTWTVRDVDTVSPDGFVVVARIAIGAG